MSDLITADLVLLDENLGETRFDVIAKLAQAVVNAGRATDFEQLYACLLYTSPSSRDRTRSRMPSSA